MKKDWIKVKFNVYQCKRIKSVFIFVSMRMRKLWLLIKFNYI